MNKKNCSLIASVLAFAGAALMVAALIFNLKDIDDFKTFTEWDFMYLFSALILAGLGCAFMKASKYVVAGCTIAFVAVANNIGDKFGVNLSSVARLVTFGTIFALILFVLFVVGVIFTEKNQLWAKIVVLVFAGIVTLAGYEVAVYSWEYTKAISFAGTAILCGGLAVLFFALSAFAKEATAQAAAPKAVEAPAAEEEKAE